MVNKRHQGHIVDKKIGYNRGIGVFFMKEYQKVISRLSEITDELNVDISKLNPKVQATVSGRKYELKRELAIVERQALNLIPSNSVLILLEGNVTNASLDAFGNLKLKPIDLNSFSAEIAKRSRQMSGEYKFNSFTFTAIRNDIVALSQLTGFSLKIASNFSGAVNSGSEEELTNLVRGYLRENSGADPELLYSLYASYTDLRDRNLNLSPLPIVVYNLNGLDSDDFKKLYSRVEVIKLEHGTEEEARNAMMELVSKVRGSKKSSSKQTKSTKKQETNANEEGNENE